MKERAQVALAALWVLVLMLACLRKKEETSTTTTTATTTTTVTATETATTATATATTSETPTIFGPPDDPVPSARTTATTPTATTKPTATPTTKPSAPPTTTASAGKPTFKVGQALAVMWKGKPYPATVLAVLPGDRYKIHYTGYEASWDEIVGLDRIVTPKK